MWHFSVRVAHAEELHPLTAEETTQYIDKQLEVMNLPKPQEEVYALIYWYTQGVLRVLGNLFSMIARILKINEDVVKELTQRGCRNSPRDGDVRLKRNIVQTARSAKAG